MPKNVDFKLDQIVSTNFCPPSRVVGIDNYTLKPFEGAERRWQSYTLISDHKAEFARWWMVNVPDHGAHYFVLGSGIPPEHALFDKTQSGLCVLETEGVSLSTDKSALIVYRTPESTFHSKEVFDNGEVLSFLGRPFEP